MRYHVRLGGRGAPFFKVWYNCLMEPKLSESQKHKLQALGVRVVYLFGSSAENYRQPQSDVDIGVVLADREAGLNISKLYNALYDMFTDVFPGQEIDLVFLQRAGLELNFDVISHGRAIYESPQADRPSFEERVQLLYADFKPLLNNFDRAVLGKI